MFPILSAPKNFSLSISGIKNPGIAKTTDNIIFKVIDNGTTIDSSGLGIKITTANFNCIYS